MYYALRSMLEQAVDYSLCWSLENRKSKQLILDTHFQSNKLAVKLSKETSRIKFYMSLPSKHSKPENVHHYAPEQRDQLIPMDLRV